MTKERRNFGRRTTDTFATVATIGNQDLDSSARVINLSVNGLRLATPASLMSDQRYRVKLAKTNSWFEIVVQERIGDEYRCRIETSWDDLQDVIRQSDDLTLLVLASSEVDGDG